jgi:5-formyltetrahydrofolate cyclo-ligase
MIPETTIKVGVCFEFQRVLEIPREPHDVRMDAVVYG